MNLVDSIAQMAMNMSAARFSQDLQMTMMKKSMESSADLASNLIDMMDSVPKFAGDNGFLLDVRA
ncbi:MAG: YjfB family protein [Oscillospiraceae bacterium]|nr:YjfB family protein [Oscillospiraceae bacterium]